MNMENKYTPELIATSQFKFSICMEKERGYQTSF